MTALSPGSVFAGYEIEELAGRGGMGVVYRAVEVELERTVALKLISSDLGEIPAFRQRFQSEYRIAASLDHPNIVTLYRAGEQDGVLFLAMRFVAGRDLRSEIAELGRLPPPRAVHITAQIAAALDAAHDKGLVHRDVKPANILLGPGDHPYLSDFGLSKRLLADSEETVTENLLGTLDYVAPEQIQGRAVDARTDVYALGCVLFHALSGAAPFAAHAREAKLLAHVREPPGPLGAGVPAGLDDVVARAMEKSPAERFQSAGELAAAANDALAAAAKDPYPTVLSRAEDDRARGRAKKSGRGYRRLLSARALLSPFSLALLAAILLAGLLFGVLAIAVPVALLIYLAAAAVVAFDDDAAAGSAPGKGGQG